MEKNVPCRDHNYTLEKKLKKTRCTQQRLFWISKYLLSRQKRRDIPAIIICIMMTNHLRQFARRTKSQPSGLRTWRNTTRNPTHVRAHRPFWIRFVLINTRENVKKNVINWILKKIENFIFYMIILKTNVKTNVDFQHVVHIEPKFSWSLVIRVDAKYFW